MKKYIYACLIVIVALTGCSKKSRDMSIDIYFVRDGLVTEGEGIKNLTIDHGDEQIDKWSKGDLDRNVVYSKNRFLYEFRWTPGETYNVVIETLNGEHTESIQAPLKPSPMQVALINLENIYAHDSEMGTAPDTFVKFSPDGDYLAIGSFKGYLRVVDVKSGKVTLEKKMAEGMVKRIGWGEIDGKQVIYAGEQSPDAFLYCIDAQSGEILWKYRTADDIETSRPEDADQRYAVYKLPGVFQLTVLPDGDIIMTATHGWDKNGEYLYKCLVYRIDGQTGEIKWKWPGSKPLPYGIMWLAVDEGGEKIAFVTSSWLDVKETDNVYSNGAMYALDGTSGRVLWEYVVPPLAPYYDKTSAWQGVGITPDGRRAVLGLSDGRTFMFDVDSGKEVADKNILLNEPLWVKDTGTPVVIGEIPVAAQVSYAAVYREAYFLLPGTSVPPGVGSAQKRKPAPHPSAGNIFAYTLDGELSWKWKTPGTAQGIFLSADGRWMAVASSETFGSDDVNDFGISLFDLDVEGEGTHKLVYTYPTEGPVFFMADISADGRYVAAVEMPLRLSDRKTVAGEYRVHIIH